MNANQWAIFQTRIKPRAGRLQANQNQKLKLILKFI